MTVPPLDNQEICLALEKIKRLKCKNSIRYASTVIIHQLTEICASNVLTVGDQQMLKFYYNFRSDMCEVDVVDEKILFTTKNQLCLQSSEVLTIDCMLHSRCQHASTPYISGYRFYPSSP